MLIFHKQLHKVLQIDCFSYPIHSSHAIAGASEVPRGVKRPRPLRPHSVGGNVTYFLAVKKQFS